MGGVNITLANGNLGSTLQTNDGVAGIILNANEEGMVLAGRMMLFTSMAAVAGAGITQGGNPFLWSQLSNFYAEAGKGAELYVMPVESTKTITQMCDIEGDYIGKLLDGAEGRIKLLGVVSNDRVVYDGDVVITNGLNADVYDALDNLAAVAESYDTNKHWPFRAVIGGTSYQNNPGLLADITNGTTNNYAAVLIGDTQEGDGSAVGLVLGRLATIAVQRKVSRVRSGALNTDLAYIGDSAVSGSVLDECAAIAGLGFITFVTYPNVQGYFFSHDGTASATTDDYHFLARGRIIDKAHRITYATFVQEVDDEVPVNTDGTLDAGFCKWLSQQIVNQINNSMTVNKEISSVSCTINPAQNILSTNNLNVELRIVPVGYATDITVNLGFRNPAL